ncbi:MAG TPA: acetylornithine deacetylase/succinyl-diaminopimelate desuccinylase family protein [Vicinamibacterales bacterium]|nr:acetylornithine deacetylase/succinyl-diaminopimelate desuccinylase family protein [Vicinamibacterales bacterium]
MAPTADRVLAQVEALEEEAVAFASALIRIPTVNPPGEHYEACARLIGETLAAHGLEIEYHAAEGRPEHTPAHPRLNVIGTRRGRASRPLVHLNGHFDVVPPGAGWTVDPFGGEVRDGRIWGRGACDMKAGVAAAVFAVEAIRRADVALHGSVEISGTVDEESGGFAGVAWLAQQKRISADRTDFAIIPEPLYVDRICVGHRGVYWFEVETRGRIAHGSMPFHGVNAVDHLGVVLERMRHRLQPALASRRTDVPVIPAAARHATLNINGIVGGQPVDGIQTPCVADRCRAVFDRRFLLEEGFERTRAEIVDLLDGIARDLPDFDYALRDLMVVHPTVTPDGSPVVAALERALQRVLGRSSLVASPGTYDQKHFARIAGVPHCVAYGPGILDLAHQPDEYCDVADLMNATRVIALAVLDLTRTVC